jgi:hypothetical protein
MVVFVPAVALTVLMAGAGLSHGVRFRLGAYQLTRACPKPLHVRSPGVTHDRERLSVLVQGAAGADGHRLATVVGAGPGPAVVRVQVVAELVRDEATEGAILGCRRVRSDRTLDDVPGVLAG